MVDTEMGGPKGQNNMKVCGPKGHFTQDHRGIFPTDSCSKMTVTFLILVERLR